MHRKENCSIPRLDLLDQSKFYIQHTKNLKKMKPAVNTSSIEPVKHFSVAHKEKEKEWKYADSISKMCYHQIQESTAQHNRRSISNLSSSRRNASTNSANIYQNTNKHKRPLFNTRTNIFPSSPKGGIYNYSASFDSSSLSASGMLSKYLSPQTQIDDDGSISSPSSSIFLTQQKKKSYEKYQYSSLENPRLMQKIQDEPFEVQTKDGMKFVKFSKETKDSRVGSNECLASRLNSRFRKTFFIGPTNSSAYTSIEQPKSKNNQKESLNPYYFNCDLQFEFHSNSQLGNNKKKNKAKDNKKGNKKPKKSQIINEFEHAYEDKEEIISKRIVKLKILKSFSYDFSTPNENPSIIWADQKDLLSQDGSDGNDIEPTTIKENVKISTNPIDNIELSSSNSAQTAVNFTIDEDDERVHIVLEESPLEAFELFELEISSNQHVLDIALNDANISESDEYDSKRIIDEDHIKPPVIQDDTSKLEALPKQLMNLIDNTNKNDLNSNYSYYSNDDEN